MMTGAIEVKRKEEIRKTFFKKEQFSAGIENS